MKNDIRLTKQLSKNDFESLVNFETIYLQMLRQKIKITSVFDDQQEYEKIKRHFRYQTPEQAAIFNLKMGNNDMFEWLERHTDDLYYIKNPIFTGKENSWVIHFLSKDDLLKFKLVWGGNVHN